MNKVAIYGVGDYGKKLYTVCKKIGCQVSLFIQSELAESIEYEGIKIVSFSDFINMKEEYIILVAVKNPPDVKEIISRFLANNYNINNIFDCSTFIFANYMRIEGKLSMIGDKECVFCNYRVVDFKPSGIQNELFHKVKIIGGGYRENAICPYCNSLDRNRWVYWVLLNKTNIFESESTVLHFAPEEELKKKLMQNALCDYYAGDIVLQNGNHKIDVTDIPYRSDFFDYVIINHVLEHIQDEEKAFRELRRILKEKGKLILSFPIAREIDTLEMSGVLSDEERLLLFGQKDHVRLYGKDYKHRIENYGFTVREYIPKDILDISKIIKYGFLKDDVLLICERNLQWKKS